MNKALLVLLTSLGFMVAGCNTTRGIGQDIEATGDAIEDAAEDAMDKPDDDR